MSKSRWPAGGDYERRERGLEALMVPQDAVEWDILRAEMRSGVVASTPLWAVVPYGILRAYALQRGRSLGAHVAGLCEHPMCYLWHALELGHGGARWPALVVSAYDELPQ